MASGSFYEQGTRLLTPAAFEGPLAPAAGPLLAAVWRACERELERCNAWSFDDLLAIGLAIAQPRFQFPA